MTDSLDSPPEQNPDFSFTVEELNRFLIGVGGAATPCPMCANPHWILNDSPGPLGGERVTGALGVAGMDSKSLRMGQFYPLVHLNCSRCGWLRLHHAHVLKQWLRDHSETGSGNAP